jgi:hypothetical protein
MKYYKINIERINKIDNILIGRANGEKITNAHNYFYKMREGKILYDAPVFDYFFLKSYEEKEYWEKYLMDVHSFIGEGSQIGGWFVSEDLKLLLETFNLTQPHHFYPSKLLYKGNKQNYYIFQYTGNIIYEQILEYINYPESIFGDPTKKMNVKVSNKDGFLLEYDRISDENRGIENIIQNKRLVLKKTLDFFSMSSLTMGNIVSERLKQAIETMGITGFKFSELDYEVVIEECK